MTLDFAPALRVARFVCLAASLTTLGVACARGQSTRGAAEPPREPESASISLSEAGAGQWTIALHTSRPTAQLRFARNPDDSRGRRWQVEGAFQLIHEDGADFLRRKDHGLFQTV